MYNYINLSYLTWTQTTFSRLSFFKAPIQRDGYKFHLDIWLSDEMNWFRFGFFIEFDENWFSFFKSYGFFFSRESLVFKFSKNYSTFIMKW